MTEFYIGATFTINEYTQAYEWMQTQDNPYYAIKELAVDGIRTFEIIDTTPSEEELTNERKTQFLNQFFSLGEYGYFRKQPKGYGSAVESLNTAFNVVTILQKLPADTLTFYKEPNFNDAEQCTEEWLVENSYKNEEMTGQDFAQFYAQFMTAWNAQEHK
jgi:hypothetical protein